MKDVAALGSDRNIGQLLVEIVAFVAYKAEIDIAALDRTNGHFKFGIGDGIGNIAHFDAVLIHAVFYKLDAYIFSGTARNGDAGYAVYLFYLGDKFILDIVGYVFGVFGGYRKTHNRAVHVAGTHAHYTRFVAVIGKSDTLDGGGDILILLVHIAVVGELHSYHGAAFTGSGGNALNVAYGCECVFDLFGYFFVYFVGRSTGVTGSYHYHRHIHLGGGFYFHTEYRCGTENEQRQQAYGYTYRSFDCKIRQCKNIYRPPLPYLAAVPSRVELLTAAPSSSLGCQVVIMASLSEMPSRIDTLSVVVMPTTTSTRRAVPLS